MHKTKQLHANDEEPDGNQADTQELTQAQEEG
jgi:hypothetical protein